MENPLVKNRKTSLLVLSAVFGMAFILFTGCRRPPDYSVSSQRIAEEGSWVRGYSTSDETVVENQSPQEGEQTAPIDSLPPAENTVWITRKGVRYHSSSSCSNMKNPYTVTLEQAQASGRTPCRKCW